MGFFRLVVTAFAKPTDLPMMVALDRFCDLIVAHILDVLRPLPESRVDWLRRKLCERYPHS